MSPSTQKHKKQLWWLVFIPLLLVAGGMAYWLWQQGQTPPPDPRLESLERLAADSVVRPDFYFEAGFPRWFSGRVAVEGADSVARARAFLERYKELYGLSDPNLELAVQKTGGENDEFVFFYQTYQGFEVYAGQILVMLAGNEVIATLGPLLPAGLVIDTSPLLEADQAEKLARERLEAPTAVLAGPTTPVIFDPVLLGIGERAPRLAWRVAVRAAETWNVLVDAQSGEILDMDKFADFGYTLDLEDANYNSAENSSCYWTTTDDDWIGDEDGILEDYLGDVDAVNTWWHARNAYAFYANNFNVAGYDTEDSVVEVYVHAGIDNGRWSEGAGCDLIEFADGWVGWDGMVHEYTHGVISHTSQLGSSSNEAGALNEAFADTMAMLADPDDWSMGEDRTNGQGAFRWYDKPLTMDFYDAE